VAKLGFGIVDTDAHHEFISIASEAIWAHRSSETEKNNESTRKNLAGNILAGLAPEALESSNSRDQSARRKVAGLLAMLSLQMKEADRKASAKKARNVDEAVAVHAATICKRSRQVWLDAKERGEAWFGAQPATRAELETALKFATNERNMRYQLPLSPTQPAPAAQAAAPKAPAVPAMAPAPAASAAPAAPPPALPPVVPAAADAQVAKAKKKREETHTDSTERTASRADKVRRCHVRITCRFLRPHSAQSAPQPRQPST